MKSATKEVLEMALEGFRLQKLKIDAQMADVQAQLADLEGGTTNLVVLKPKRQISAAARARMGAAQRRRWAAVRKASKTKKRPVKRTYTAEGLKAISDAAKKMWAERRAMKAKSA